MNCIVTGGAGFIGGHLVRRLLKDRHYVLVIDQKGPPVAVSEGTGVGYWISDDISEPLQVRQFFACPTFDVLFHLAAVSRTPPAITDPTRCTEVNVLGSVNVLTLAKTLHIPRVVLSSSNVVYAADTPYKASKLAMEEFAAAYNAMYGMSVISLRYSNVYGPFIPKGDLACLASMRDSLLRWRYIEITGDGTQSRDFTHVDDIVEGNLKAAQSNHKGIVDLCTGVNWPMKDAARMLLDSGPTPPTTLEDPRIRFIGERKGDILHIVQDPGPAYEILGWKSNIDFRSGIRDVWQF